jgi:hypothetical protein
MHTIQSSKAQVPCAPALCVNADKSPSSEPILPARTANQSLARYWFAVRAGEIGSPARRFIKRDVIECDDAVFERHSCKQHLARALTIDSITDAA